MVFLWLMRYMSGTAPRLLTHKAVLHVSSGMYMSGVEAVLGLWSQYV